MSEFLRTEAPVAETDHLGSAAHGQVVLADFEQQLARLRQELNAFSALVVTERQFDEPHASKTAEVERLFNAFSRQMLSTLPTWPAQSSPAAS